MLSNTLKRIHVIKIHWHCFFTLKTFFFLCLCLYRHFMIDLWQTCCMSTLSRTTTWYALKLFKILLRWEMFFFTIIWIFTIIFFFLRFCIHLHWAIVFWQTSCVSCTCYPLIFWFDHIIVKTWLKFFNHLFWFACENSSDSWSDSTPKTFFFLRLCLFRHLMIDLWQTSCMSTLSRTATWCVIHKIKILLLQNWSLLRWEMFFFTIILIFTIIFFSKIFLTRCKLVKFFLRDFQASWTLKRLNLIRPTLR